MEAVGNFMGFIVLISIAIILILVLAILLIQHDVHKIRKFLEKINRKGVSTNETKRGN